MITIKDKRECCGCSACASVCPKRCITMCEDNEGFLYPFVDTDILYRVRIVREYLSCDSCTAR